MNAEVGIFIHRLWTVIACASALWLLLETAWALRRDRERHLRLAALAGSVPAARVRRGWRPSPGAVAPFAAVAAGLILVGGVAGGVAGLAAGFGIRRWLRGRPPPDREGRAVAAELPLAADLLAACLAAGAGPREAAREVGRALDGPVARRLAQGAGELRLGGDPHTAWARLAALPGASGLAACLVQSAVTGVPVVDAVTRLAADCRAEQSRAATARARRAAVQVTGPLGLCFLPAFLAIGVAPVVIGLAGRLLGGA